MLSVANVFFLLKHALLKAQKYTRATKYLNISECFVKLNKVHKLLLEQKKKNQVWINHVFRESILS